MKESYVFLADGFEEVEALTAVDVMRRAGMTVVTISINDSLEVTGAHGVNILADSLISDEELDNIDWIVLPGGMPGATNLYNCARLREAIETHNAAGGNIAAICAAPAVVLGQMGILQGHKATCYPGFEELCKGAQMQDTPTTTDDNLVCGNGPANALPWALAIVAKAQGEDKAQEVAQGMLTSL